MIQKIHYNKKYYKKAHKKYTLITTTASYIHDMCINYYHHLPRLDSQNKIIANDDV